MSPLFAHQESAYRALRATAEVFFGGTWRKLPVIPRFNRLLVGPSGVGKTHLVRRLSGELRLPMLELASANWIPLGCMERAAEITWRQIARFCHNHQQGIIFIDEVDKLGGCEPSSWMNHIRVESFSALDRTFPSNLSWEVEEDCAHRNAEECFEHAKNILFHHVLIVGGGAFQHLWMSKNAKTMGFGDGLRAKPHAPEQNELATVIPTEVANRFVTPPILLMPLGEPEYRLLLEQLCRCLPARLAEGVMRAGEASIAEAVTHGLGCRWAERLLLEALTEEYESTTPRQQEFSL